jgi:hypothetical protein
MRQNPRKLMLAASFWKPHKGAKVCIHPMRERHRSRAAHCTGMGKIEMNGEKDDNLVSRIETIKQEQLGLV